MKRYEVCITVWLDAEDEDHAERTVEAVFFPDTSTKEDHDMSWSVSSAIEA